jgi:hypothetical protein
MKFLYKLARDQLQTTLDCELAWSNFIRPLDLRNEDESRKYCRLNIDLGIILPKIDEVEQLAFLEETTRRWFSDDKLIDQVADTLIASLFYFTLSSARKSEIGGTRWNCTGQLSSTPLPIYET